MAEGRLQEVTAIPTTDCNGNAGGQVGFGIPSPAGIRAGGAQSEPRECGRIRPGQLADPVPAEASQAGTGVAQWGGRIMVNDGS